MLFLGGLNGLDRFNMDDVIVFGRFWLASSPVGRLFRPSRSMHFGDVSETNGRETFKNFLGPRDPKRIGRA